MIINFPRFQCLMKVVSILKPPWKIWRLTSRIISHVAAGFIPANHSALRVLIGTELQKECDN
jgi:hypothetical protein